MCWQNGKTFDLPGQTGAMMGIRQVGKARDFVECCKGSTVLSLCESGIGSNPVSTTMTPAFVGSSPTSPAYIAPLCNRYSTAPFQGVNPGSSPGGVTCWRGAIGSAGDL